MSAQDKNVFSVGELNSQIRDTLQRTFRSIWVAAEITDLSRPNSGHIYFSLKDASGTIKAVTWRTDVQRLRFDPEDGMKVLCCGDVDVYPPRGTYQLIVRRMQLQGEGELQAALRKLRAKLEAEGLFDRNRKRPLKKYPKRIAVVTSPSGAALRDFLEVVRRRWNDIEVVIVPTRVQGMDVGPEIARAIRRTQQIPNLDAILVTRGGGSLEDLWGFNDERVVRAIFSSAVPVVSAVGHEIDVTLSDLVADVRALTPTEAGELMVPDAREVAQRLAEASARMRNVLEAKIEHGRARLNALAESRAFRDPYVGLRDRERMLDELQQRVNRAIRFRMDRAHDQIANRAGKLESLSPLQVLSRGYSITQRPDGSIVRSSEEVRVDDELRVLLSDGELSAIVTRLHKQAAKSKSNTPST